MRYFLNTSAAKPVVAGGMTFEFEPVGLRGGSWLGILAVADDAAASLLAGSQSANVEEITFETYDGIKKKQTRGQVTTSNAPTLPNLLPSQGQAVADRAGRPTEQSTVKFPQQANPAGVITPVTLLTTRRQPPAEPMLAAGSFMKRPR